jgi:hypothetical protein
VPRLCIAPITFIGRVWRIVTYRGWATLRQKNPSTFGSKSKWVASLAFGCFDHCHPSRAGSSGIARSRAIRTLASACKRIAVVPNPARIEAAKQGAIEPVEV